MEVRCQILEVAKSNRKEGQNLVREWGERARLMCLSIGIRLETVIFNFYLRFVEIQVVEMMVSGRVVELTVGEDVNSKDLLKSRLARKF